MDQQQEQLANIFIPYALREMQRVKDNGIRFAHYTAADTGLTILRTGRMLLRNSTLMNDFSEVRHGLACLKAAYEGAMGERLKAALQQVQSDLPAILEANFNEQILDVLGETYLTSLSEHSGVHEERFGRLSMWRAYAPRNGIAFVMNTGPFLCESNALGALTSPVAYATPNEFEPAFHELVQSIEQNIAMLKPLGAALVHDLLMNTFRMAVQSIKHPAFKEESEWRIIYTPKILERGGSLTEEQRKRVPSEIMSIRGAPQRVYAIPFQDYPDEGFVGATIPDLLDRVLVGPSLDSYTIQQAFIAELQRLGVPDAENRVTITGIPLRH